MNVPEYFESLTKELNALKNRVRNLIDDAHWPTEGGWKESVLRTALRRHLPGNIQVGHGFVVKREQASRQIDVLLYDTSYPVLHKDGDLVIITSDAVRGIIEVKSRITVGGMREAIEKLADNSAFILEGRREGDRIPDAFFVGLFAYDSDARDASGAVVLQHLRNAANGDRRRVVNHVSLGPTFFVRYWPRDPYDRAGVGAYSKWHYYRLQGKAPGYFINNVVSSVAQDSVSTNESLWFPREGKEIDKLSEIGLT